MLVVGHELVVTVELVGEPAFLNKSVAYSAVLDEVGVGLAHDRDLELVADLQYDGFLAALVAVQILLADARVVAVGLHHCHRLNHYFSGMSGGRSGIVYLACIQR